jgi:hypothetical protein
VAGSFTDAGSLVCAGALAGGSGGKDIGDALGPVICDWGSDDTFSKPGIATTKAKAARIRARAVKAARVAKIRARAVKAARVAKAARIGRPTRAPEPCPCDP